jgi:CHAT domain-containing protein
MRVVANPNEQSFAFKADNSIRLRRIAFADALVVVAAVIATTFLHDETRLRQARDLRELLSESESRISGARLVDVTRTPPSAHSIENAHNSELAENIEHWLRVGQRIETSEKLRLGSLSENLDLYANRDQFSHVLNTFWHLAQDSKTWDNIALARAASGDVADGASMLETAGMFRRYRGTRAAEALSDAAALRFKQSEATNDVSLVLKALVLANRAVELSPSLAEAQFNRAVALEKLGLGGAAAAAYRVSLERTSPVGSFAVRHAVKLLESRSEEKRHEANLSWVKETEQRVRRLSKPSTKQLWLQARALELASHDAYSNRIVQVARDFPEKARIAGEVEYLSGWARAAQRGDKLEAERNLSIARNIGQALRASSGESLLADSVAAIDESIKQKSRRSIDRLARGHDLYEQATADANHRRSAITFVEAAKQLDVSGSPMGNAARFAAVIARFNDTSITESLNELRKIQPRLASTHIALHALSDSHIGRCLAERGDVYDAFETYSRAEREFEHLGESEASARMCSLVAHMLTLMGEPVDAWRMRMPAIQTADSSGDKTLLRLIVGETVFDEMFERNDEKALALYSAVTPPPVRYPSIAYFPSTDSVEFLRSIVKFQSAGTMLDSINGRTLEPDVENDLKFAEAISLCRRNRNPKRAEALLSECIAYSTATDRKLMLPYVYLHRAVAREHLSDDEGAIADLRQSISILENRRKKINRLDLRDSWVRIGDDVFEELFDLYWRRGEDEQAFATGERWRGFAFMNDEGVSDAVAQGVSARQIGSRLQPGVAMVVFTSSSRHTIVTLIERDRISTHRLTETPGNLLRDKRRLHEAISHGLQAEASSLAEDLYASLIAPLGLTPTRIKTLVIVADRPLKDIAFAFFRDRKGGQYLIEQFTVVHAVSASLFVQSHDGHLSVPRMRTAVTVGDPAFDVHAYPFLPSLPAARDESLAVARSYAVARSFVGSQATLRNLTDSVADADVIDIATHTTQSAGDPSLLDLVLASDGKHSGGCSLRNITTLPLKKGSTVFIAGCETAVSRDAGDLRDFAGSFLAAGASDAVATLWSVDDEMTREFAIRFHHALTELGSAAAAARFAQLSMLRSRSTVLSDPRSWSGFQVYAVRQ